MACKGCRQRVRLMMRDWKKWLIAGAAAVSLWMGTAAVVGAAERPVLRVGLDYAVPAGVDGETQPQFDKTVTDYMQVLANYAGMDVEFVPGSLSANLERLQDGSIDVLPDLVVTPERSATMDFSKLPTGFVSSSVYLHGGTAAFDVPRRTFRLGVMRQGYQSPVLDDVFRSEGQAYETQEYPTIGAMQEAFASGRIDGYAVNIWPDAAQEAAMAYDVVPTRFAVKKGNQELLDQLNRAADLLAIARPTFLADTYNLHEGEHGEVPLLLDRFEREYLVAHPTLRVIVVANERPYAYIDETGALAGAMRVVTERVAADLGVTLDVVPMTDYEAAYQAMADGKADFLLNMFLNPEWGAQRALDQTAPFVTSYFTGVTRRTGLPDKPVIATLDNRLAKELIAKHFPNQEVRTYATIQECLEAVRHDEADVTYIRVEAAQYETMRGSYPDLTVSGRIAFSHGIVMGVPQSGDSVLLRVLDKEIHHMGRRVTEAYYAEEAKQTFQNRSLFSYIYTYPQYALSTLILLVCAASFAFGRYRRMKKQNEAHMQSIIDHDRMTGLHNTEWLEREGQRLVERDPAKAAERAVVVLRIVRPDVIVGTYGREAVSVFFRRLGKQLEVARYPELIGMRSAAAEIVCLTHPVTHDELEVRLAALLRANEYLEVGDMLVRVPLEAGVCYLGEPPIDIKKALNNADIAAHGEQVVRFFSGELQQETMLTSRMESLQQKALERREFHIWYQPKYDLKTRKCIGAEALVRWQSSELGFLPPGKFISLFEGNGFILQLDFYNLEHVMQFQREAKEKGLPVVPISVNQSRVHMREQGYLEKMQALVEEYTTEGIELELTETAFDFTDRAIREHSLDVVAALHAMGFAIDMDDFGSGYSDLSLLNQLPLDVMKIDRSLLLASEGSKRMCVVLGQMVDLGHALGMKVICEGIETTAQEELLIGCGCEYGQGYLYGKPMKRAEFEAFLKEHA